MKRNKVLPVAVIFVAIGIAIVLAVFKGQGVNVGPGKVEIKPKPEVGTEQTSTSKNGGVAVNSRGDAVPKGVSMTHPANAAPENLTQKSDADGAGSKAINATGSVTY